MQVWVGVGEVAGEQVKCLSRKQHPSLDPQYPQETPNKILYTCNPNTEWDVDRQSLLDNQFSQS